MISIRDYQNSDAPAVGILIADTFSAFNLADISADQRDRYLGPFKHARSHTPVHRAAIAEVIDAYWVFVAEDQGEIVGVLRGRPARLHSLFVRADHHRQGIGRRLIARFEEACLQSGASVIRLQATLYAVPFYQRLGYVRSTGVRSGRIFDGEGFVYQPMKKVLAGPLV